MSLARPSFAGLLSGLLVTTAAAESPWRFDAPLTVTPHHGAQIFHQLHAAGRKSIAVSGERVAVVWEDNHDGTPRAYVATKARLSGPFSAPRKLSHGTASGPSVVGLGQGRFAFAWEEGGRVWLRLMRRERLGPPLSLSAAPGAEISLATRGDRLYAVWTAAEPQPTRIHFAELQVTGGRVRVISQRPVDAEPPRAPQQFASVAVAPDGHVVVAWEDRRPGHTIIVAARRDAQGTFAPPQQINEAVKSMSGYGAGSGAARVTLAASPQRVIAVWLDKRAGLTEGYDVYSAEGDAQGRFGVNRLVQDSFGESVAQWRPALAANRHDVFVAAWDDDREGNSDIWLAWRTKDGWSADLAVPGAAGRGEQTDAVLALDDGGYIHLAWIERADPDAPTRLRYVLGRPSSPR